VFDINMEAEESVRTLEFIKKGNYLNRVSTSRIKVGQEMKNG